MSDELSSFLAKVPTEDSPVSPVQSSTAQVETEQEEKETPPESPAENKPTEEAPSPDGATASSQADEEKLPFHKHPRWKEMYESKKRLESEVQTMREELESKIASVAESVPKSAEELPDDFVKLYGDNPEAFRLWKRQQDAFAEKIKADLRAEAQRATTQERAALTEGEKYVESSLQNLEQDGKVFDRNEFMKFMLDFKEKYGAFPSDENDNIDFSRGFELFTVLQAKGSEGAEKSKARKEIAAFSGDSGRGGGESKPKSYMTSQDLSKVSWDDFRA